ncbi:LysR substrate-binding domain-containing protein [Streptomyces sp. 11x1]|uniref:LysR substrate-binding domain-containing protein n=1 Tax=Streptomyces sp. 11x1 TaxID=3038642 RepID=UPI00292E9491|nr:LysR substrate-binding domain-containing protein [Streptomyces sp. 11x1]WNZ11761.1 LysR substrate-binding domain-containing protein [Streptomyces sp. 11x1]
METEALRGQLLRAPQVFDDGDAGGEEAGVSGAGAVVGVVDVEGVHPEVTPRHAHTALEFPTSLALVRAGLGAAVLPTLALTDAPPATVALPMVPVAGHRRIAAVRPASPSGPRPRTSAVVEALRRSAENLGLTPAP